MSELFSTSDTEANEIALGLLQISSLPSGPWNDPTAPGLGAEEKALLAEQWGIHDRADWLRYVQAQLLHMARLSRVAVVASFLWRDRPNLFGLPPDELLPFVRSAIGGRAEVLGDPADPEWVLRVFTGPQG